MQILGEENCSKITHLCAPDFFLFDKVTLDEKALKTIRGIENHHLMGRQQVWLTKEETPIFLKFSNNMSLFKFPNLKKLSFRSTYENCYGLLLENLNYEVDLNSLQFFKNFKTLTLSSSKEIDLTPLENSKIVQLNLFGNEMDQITGLDTLSTCQVLRVIYFKGFKQDNYNFLLNIPNLTMVKIHQETCSTLLPEIKRKLMSKDINVIPL